VPEDPGLSIDDASVEDDAWTGALEDEAEPADDADPVGDAELEDDVEPVAARPVELPVLALVDGRSPDPRICPFLRLDADGKLLEPVARFDPSHVCIAFGDPRPQSGRQQELLCLRPSHANCSRYLRGLTVAQPPAPAPRTGPPRATVAAVIVLLVSIGFSFGFVLQRGGIDLAAFAVVTPGASGSGAPSPVPTATTVAAGSPTPAATATASIVASPSPSLVTPSPVVTPAPTPSATPSPSPTPAATSDRYALLEPCPNRPDCWIYTVRSGDNLFSIANYFGHPLETVYRLNPWTRTQGIRHGDELILPPPTR
jgi:hypothetical protein